MSHKAFTQVSVFVLLLLAFLAIPGSTQAGGGCGGTYIVQGDETLDVIAWRCDTTVSALYAANPGFSGYLYAGQTLVIPGADYNYYNNYNYYAPVSYSSTYIVQVGDTFSGIASRYGVSINDLRAANPYLWDINYLYAGQVIYVPGSFCLCVFAGYNQGRRRGHP
jgi:LysM repeat protein